MGGQRLRAAEHQVGGIAADHQALQLLHLQLGDALDGPGQRVVQARQDARRDHRAETRDHRLLIGRHQVHPGEHPQRPARPTRRGRRCGRGPEPMAHGRARSGWRGRERVELRLSEGAHFAPASPCVRTFSSSESELRMAVVLSSSTFL